MSSAAAKVDEISEVKTDVKVTGNSFKRHSVLIVDDELGIRNFLQKGLEKQFGLVEVAEDVESAEALRQRCNFDLIISVCRVCRVSIG